MLPGHRAPRQGENTPQRPRRTGRSLSPDDDHGLLRKPGCFPLPQGPALAPLFQAEAGIFGGRRAERERR